MQALTPKLELKLRAFRNARYHEDREGHFQSLARWSNFAVVVFGSGAFAGGWAEAHGLAVWSGAFAALAGGAQLAFDFAGKASVHHDLRRRFLEILVKADIQKDDGIDELNARMQEIYTDEPEVYNAVNALAHNAAQKAFGRAENSGVIVRWWQAMARHWLRFDPRDFPPQNQVPPVAPSMGTAPI